MERNKKEIIMYDSDEAAVYETRSVTGWWSSNGICFFELENNARYDGCSHRICRKCKNNIVPKHRLRCDECQAVIDREEYNKMDYVEWDEDIPLCLYRDDKFFFSPCDIDCFCDDNDIDSSDLMLVVCVPQYGRQFSVDDFSDDLPGDAELPDGVYDAMNEFNEVIKNAGPFSWVPGKMRTSYKRESPASREE